ncbi:MAG TPA: proline racemase family protein [Steroidobacteraceae bacterium]|nr:proline racemase family protein [Steroidobacteraceae bacterium]
MTHPGLHLEPPEGWLRIGTIDMHTGGEPLRVIVSGLPAIAGDDVLEKRRHFREHLDHLRTGLMFEPRGHADMYGAVLTSSQTADFDVFFLHNEGYSTMCGHAIVALTKLVIEAGLVAGPEVSFAVPAGRIEARAHVRDGRIVRTSFRNVPSFVYRRDESLQVEGVGAVRFDIAYGGAFYAIVDAPSLGLELGPTGVARLIDAGRRIKRAVMAAMPIEHPFERDLSFLYGTIFVGPAEDKAHHSRNVCIFADGEVDRSPTGSGVSARAAIHHAKGELAADEEITIESILGSTMTVRVAAQTTFGPFAAVIPEVAGTAHVTGRHEFWFDPADPLSRGFIFR